MSLAVFGFYIIVARFGKNVKHGRYSLHLFPVGLQYILDKGKKEVRPERQSGIVELRPQLRKELKSQEQYNTRQRYSLIQYVAKHGVRQASLKYKNAARASTSGKHITWKQAKDEHRVQQNIYQNRRGADFGG